MSGTVRLAWLPHRVIQGECFRDFGPLLVRYFLLRLRRFAVYLHHLRRSDLDRHMHDHPWAFVSIVLWGSYLEHTPEGIRRRRFGSVVYRPAQWVHRLELARPAWTLVIRFGRTRPWGFVTENGWVAWERYQQIASCE